MNTQTPLVELSNVSIESYHHHSNGLTVAIPYDNDDDFPHKETFWMAVTIGVPVYIRFKKVTSLMRQSIYQADQISDLRPNDDVYYASTYGDGPHPTEEKEKDNIPSAFSIHKQHNIDCLRTKLAEIFAYPDEELIIQVDQFFEWAWQRKGLFCNPDKPCLIRR